MLGSMKIALINSQDFSLHLLNLFIIILVYSSRSIGRKLKLLCNQSSKVWFKNDREIIARSLFSNNCN